MTTMTPLEGACLVPLVPVLEGLVSTRHHCLVPLLPVLGEPVAPVEGGEGKDGHRHHHFSWGAAE